MFVFCFVFFSFFKCPVCKSASMCRMSFCPIDMYCCSDFLLCLLMNELWGLCCVDGQLPWSLPLTARQWFMSSFIQSSCGTKAKTCVRMCLSESKVTLDISYSKTDIILHSRSLLLVISAVVSMFSWSNKASVLRSERRTGKVSLLRNVFRVTDLVSMHWQKKTEMSASLQIYQKRKNWNITWS